MPTIIETKLSKKEALTAAGKIYANLKLEAAKQRAIGKLDADGLKALIKTAIAKSNSQVKVESVRKETVSRYEKMLKDVDVMTGDK